VGTLHTLSTFTVLALDEVATAVGVRGLTVHPTEGVVLTDNDGLWDAPHAAVSDDVVCELAGVVPWPVERAVPAALHGDQRPVGARDEARTVVRVGAVAGRLQASRVVGDGYLRRSIAVITVRVPLPHTGRGELGPHLTGVTFDGLRHHSVYAALVGNHAVGRISDP